MLGRTRVTDRRLWNSGLRWGFTSICLEFSKRFLSIHKLISSMRCSPHLIIISSRSEQMFSLAYWKGERSRMQQLKKTRILRLAFIRIRTVHDG